jgi:saccharopine dehydrogenase-like NADP-dependent oxidoreductase
MALDKALHYIDLGGDTEITIEQKALAHQRNAANREICVVPDCGVAPGIVSAIAGSYERDGMTAVHIECGGIAQDKETNYVRSFGMDGLLREYSGIAQHRANGKVVERAVTLGDAVWSNFEHLHLQRAVTSGGLSISPKISKLAALSYRTLRWPDHYRKLAGIGNTDRKLQLLRYPEVSTNNPDMLVLAVRATGSRRYVETIHKWDYDHKNNISAMAQATGYSVAAVANLIAQGRQPHYGFIPMHDFEMADIEDELHKEPGQMKLAHGEFYDHDELESLRP